MKTTELFMAIALTVVAGLMSVSCTKDSVTSDREDCGLTFSASLGNETKTTLDGTKVFWNLGDKLSLWYGTLETEMQSADYFVGVVDKNDARRATLHGFAEESPDYIAVYPQSAVSDCTTKGKLTLTLPTVQTLTPDSFAPEANVSVAYSNTTDLSFQNVGGLVAIQVYHTGYHTIRDIRLAGTGALTGKVEMKKNDIPSVTEIKDGANYVTLHCEEGLVEDIGFPGATEGFTTENGAELTLVEETEPTKAIVAKGTFYMVTLPGSHSNLSITLVDSNGCTAVARRTSPFTIERNGNTLIAKITAPSGEWASAPMVYINEIHTHNNQIELWNPNDFDIDLTGWLLVKDEKSWAFPVGSTLPANGYKVITAGQEDCSAGPMFGISGDKGFVLSLISGTTVDSIDNSGEGHAVIGVTETYGRKTDGCAEWVVFSEGTIYEDGVCDGDNSKGTEKQDDPIPVIDYSGLVINELNGNDYDAESGNDKFIELYNGSANSLDLTGVVMKKDGETVWTGAKDKHVLASGAYLVLYSSKSEGAKTCPEENVFSGGLSAKKAVRVQLFTPGGESIDDFNYATYSGTPAPASYGRNSGSGAWYYQAATAGAVNADGTEVVTGLQ